ncbi:MAG: hypothetical protein WDW38_001959 [Sanguina aurantia]
MPESIGAVDGKTPKEIEASIVWKRVDEIICKKGSKTGAMLFSGKVEPADICQGQLGDCWLLSALSCLAGKENAVQEVFITTQFNMYGKYKIRLYDKPKKRFEYLDIDDWIPIDAAEGTCVFAKPNGDEAWVLLLEKAMAKFKGSYEGLDGGSSLWALEVLTGDYCFKIQTDALGKEWGLYELVHVEKKDPASKHDYAVALEDMEKKFTPDDVFEVMLKSARSGGIMGAMSAPGSDSENTDGIVHGHAYSILNVAEVEGVKLVQMRNPWGAFEWTGSWSDTSREWSGHPKIAAALGWADRDDGVFWMEYNDFRQYFKSIDFCRRSKGWDDLTLDVHEDMPCTGPCYGCMEGCASYWCMCKGVAAVFAAPPTHTFSGQHEGCC